MEARSQSHENETMTTCNFDKSLLVDYAAGDIDVAGKVEVTAHVSRCHACKLELRFHQDLASDLQRLPRPEFPPHLEEVLVRSAVQAGRNARPAAEANGRFRFSWTPVLCTGAGLAIVAVLALILAPGTWVSPGSGDGSVIGTVGQGTTLINDMMRTVSTLQDAWDIAKDFLRRFAPLTNAIGAIVSALGLQRWLILGASVLAAALLLWRVTRLGQKRSVGHVRMRS